MAIIKGFLLLFGLCLGVTASDDVSVACAVDLDIAALSAAPSAIACGVEGNKSGLSCLRPIGHFDGAASASECSSMCRSEPYAGLCESFSYRPSTGICILWDSPFSVGGQDVPGTGVFYWDISCWADEPSCPGTEPPPPTITPSPSDPLCGVRSIHSDNYESFSTFRRGTSASQCFDICTDCWHAPRCKSFIWGTDTDGCYFYDVPAALVQTSSNQPYDIFVWDRACFPTKE